MSWIGSPYWWTLLLLLPLPLFAQKDATLQTPAQSRSGNLVDLQKADTEDLVEELGLDRILAIRFQEYRRAFGPLRSYYELHYIEDFSPSRIRMLQENSYISEKRDHTGMDWKKAVKYGKGKFRVRWKRRAPKANGYKEDRFIGDPNAAMAQIRWEVPEHGSIGLSAEKDAGEAWTDPENGLPDAIGGHLELKNKGPIRRLLFGNMSSESGGGLLMSGGSAFSGQRLPASGPLFRIRPFTGSSERSPMRGAGMELAKGKWRAGALYSRRRRSARIDTMNGTPILRTLYTDGLNRRPSRIAKKGRWRREDIAIHLGHKRKKHAFSASFLHGRSSHEKGPPRWIREKGQNRAKRESGMELHYRGSAEREQWEFSIAGDGQGRKAFSAAFSSMPHDDLFLWCNTQGAEWGYDLHRSSVARDGRPFIAFQLGGEKGLAAGWRWRTRYEWLHRKWPYYRRSGPGTMRRTRLTFIHQRKRQEEMRIELRYTARERDQGGEEEAAVKSEKEERLQLGLDWDGVLSHTLKSRVRLKGHQDMSGELRPGLFLAHDLIREWEEQGHKLYWRLAWFEAEDYGTRNYAYENDLLYAFSVPLYYRTGMRSYILLRFAMNEALTLEGKIGGWAYKDPEEGGIGSGMMQTEGPYRADLSLQLRGTF